MSRLGINNAFDPATTLKRQHGGPIHQICGIPNRVERGRVCIKAEFKLFVPSHVGEPSTIAALTVTVRLMDAVNCGFAVS